ncbi:MAG: 4Fe-4S dicluster domain-containing protein [Deltaproteobacteria bacterium]|nr:4Fe-4S dicluster domain-containing protein [Deltaproteobacteria bacterium]
MKSTLIDLKSDNYNEEISGFLSRLLASGLVGSLLVPKKNTGGDNYVQALIKDPAMLADTDVTVPVMPVQSARIIANLAVREPGEVIGVVVKPCEVRAIVELVKFQQIIRSAIMIIAVDCLGTYEPKVYSAMVKAGHHPAADLRQKAAAGSFAPLDGYAFRSACDICEFPAPNPEVVDVVIGLWGVDTAKQLCLAVRDELADAFAAKDILAINGQEAPTRQECIDQLAKARTANRDVVLGEFGQRIGSLKGMQELLSTCIRCHNCMINCPICYCRECVFRSPTFEHTPDQYLSWAERKGAMRMPANTLMFHTTRLNHMVTSCIGCGLCDTACPSDIPVMSLFRTVGMRAQQAIEYLPGRSYDEPAPVTTYKEDELQDESGAR